MPRVIFEIIEYKLGRHFGILNFKLKQQNDEIRTNSQFTFYKEP